MKHFVFRKNYLGFYDWAYAMNKIRRVIHGYGIIGDSKMKERCREEYLEAKRWYEFYLAFMDCLPAREREYVRAIEHHHIPPREADSKVVISLWIDWIGNSEINGLRELDPFEFGKKIVKAREIRGYSRRQVAEILEISEAALKFYEKGIRGVPFSVVYKLMEFLELDIN